MTGKNTFKVMIALLAALFVFSSCSDELYYDPGYKDVKGTTPLQQFRNLMYDLKKGQNYLVEIDRDCTFSPQDLLDLSASFIIMGESKAAFTVLTCDAWAGSPTNVLIKSKGSRKTIKLQTDTYNQGALFFVGPGVCLILENINVEGSDTSGYPLIQVNMGTLVLNEQASILGNTNISPDGYGGGVQVYGGVLIMNGGDIYDNSAAYGEQVYLDQGSYLEIITGQILPNDGAKPSIVAAFENTSKERYCYYDTIRRGQKILWNGRHNPPIFTGNWKDVPEMMP